VQTKNLFVVINGMAKYKDKLLNIKRILGIRKMKDNRIPKWENFGKGFNTNKKVLKGD